MGVGGQSHSPAALPPGKTRYPHYRRLGGPQSRSGRVRKISPHPTGIRSPNRPASSMVTILTELSRPAGNRMYGGYSGVPTCFKFPPYLSKRTTFPPRRKELQSEGRDTACPVLLVSHLKVLHCTPHDTA